MAKWTDEQLSERVQGVYEPVYMTSRSAVLDYYQDTYGTSWKSHAAAAISGTTDKKSRAYKSASRQFQMNTKTGQERYKGEKVTSATRAKYEAIGKTLPPIGKRPPKKIKVTFVGRVKVSEGRKKKNGQQRGDGWANAKFSVTLQGSDVLAPTFDAVFSDYFVRDSNPVTDFDVTAIHIEGA